MQAWDNAGKKRKARGWRLASPLIVFLLLFAGATAFAQQVPLPPLDLGATSFVDGIGGPGTFVQGIVEPFHSSRFAGPGGQAVPGNNSLDTVASITEIAYTSKHRFLGAYLGGELLIPVAHVDLETASGPRGSQSGVGDVIVGPFLLQWPEHKLFGKPFFQRLHAVELILPTGRYTAPASVNVGSNLISVLPQYACTLLLSPQLETSWRLHYLWNSRNNDPNPAYNASSVQPGQAVYLNASVSYKKQSRLRLGAAGYYLKEITDSRIGGQSIPDAREQIGAIGPGVWVATKPFEIYIHTFFEMGAENRPQGVRYVVRLVKIFPASQKSK